MASTRGGAGYDLRMCGRYALTPDRETVLDAFNTQLVDDLDHLHVTERYDVALTQPVVVVVPGERGRRLTAMRWGIGRARCRWG